MPLDARSVLPVGSEHAGTNRRRPAVALQVDCQRSLPRASPAGPVLVGGQGKTRIRGSIGRVVVAGDEPSYDARALEAVDDGLHRKTGRFEGGRPLGVAKHQLGVCRHVDALYRPGFVERDSPRGTVLKRRPERRCEQKLVGDKRQRKHAERRAQTDARTPVAPRQGPEPTARQQCNATAAKREHRDLRCQQHVEQGGDGTGAKITACSVRRAGPPLG